MRSLVWLGIGILGCSMAGAWPASGCLKENAGDPVPLPQCIGERPTIILNRALRDAKLGPPLRIEEIDDGEQTNFALQGVRECAGSMTSSAGRRYTGTWSYSRIGNGGIRVRFSLRPSQ